MNEQDVRDWLNNHDKRDEERFSDRPTKDEMKQIVRDALVDFFEEKGTLTKKILIGTATVIAALAVIGGGLKWLLGFIGFHYLK